MKVQIQPISLMLITGIVISLVGAAYLWGKPLVEKRTTITDFKTAENFILNLNDKILDIANNMAGTESLDIPKGLIRVIPYTDSSSDNNSIILEFVTSQPMLMNATIPLKTSSLEEVGTYGESEPRIITLTVEPHATQYKMIFKLHYRELDTETKGYKIALNNITTVGNKKITVSFDKNEIEPGNASNMGDLILTFINVEVV
jgi:hypothetical protein